MHICSSAAITDRHSFAVITIWRSFAEPFYSVFVDDSHDDVLVRGISASRNDEWISRFESDYLVGNLHSRLRRANELRASDITRDAPRSAQIFRRLRTRGNRSARLRAHCLADIDPPLVSRDTSSRSPIAEAECANRQRRALPQSPLRACS